jgi:hypothetical protein
MGSTSLVSKSFDRDEFLKSLDRFYNNGPAKG